MSYQMPGTMLSRPTAQVMGTNPLYRQPTSYAATGSGSPTWGGGQTLAGQPNINSPTVSGQPHPSTYDYQAPQGVMTPSQSQQVMNNYANNQYKPQMNQGLGGGGGGYNPSAMSRTSAPATDSQGNILQEWGKAAADMGGNIYNHISDDWGNGDNWGWEMAKDIGSDLWGGVKGVGQAAINDPMGALSAVAAVASDGASLSIPGIGTAFLQSHGGTPQQQYPQYQPRKYYGGYARGGRVKTPKQMAQELMGMGREGDTMLAHINPVEAAFLKAIGGRGSINPKTGLREFPPKKQQGDPHQKMNEEGKYDSVYNVYPDNFNYDILPNGSSEKIYQNKNIQHLGAQQARDDCAANGAMVHYLAKKRANNNGIVSPQRFQQIGCWDKFRHPLSSNHEIVTNKFLNMKHPIHRGEKLSNQKQVNHMLDFLSIKNDLVNKDSVSTFNDKKKWYEKLISELAQNPEQKGLNMSGHGFYDQTKPDLLSNRQNKFERYERKLEEAINNYGSLGYNSLLKERNNWLLNNPSNSHTIALNRLHLYEPQNSRSRMGSATIVDSNADKSEDVIIDKEGVLREKNPTKRVICNPFYPLMSTHIVHY